MSEMKKKRLNDDNFKQPNISINNSEIDSKLGKLFFGCNIPFSVVESKYFLDYTHSLNPNYKPPTRKTLSSTILNTVYQETIKNHTFSKNEKCVLVLDGWKNKSTNEKYVVGILDNANGERCFLNSWDFTEKSETRVALAEIVRKAEEEARTKYDVEIFAVVSDNVSAMGKMGRLVDQWHYGCNSHHGNLLAKDMVELSFTNKVVSVLKVFIYPQLERKLLNLGGRKISLPGTTRWCSYRNSYQCYIANLLHMRTIISEDRSLVKDAEVVDLIFSKKFEQDVLDFIIIFDPVCTLINKCQQADCNIADALQAWLNLEFPVNNESYELLLKNRKKKTIKPIALAANLLHPVYKGKLFAGDITLTNMADSFLKENLNEKGQKDLIAYLKEDGIFTKFKGVHNPQIYWSMAQFHHPDLSELAKLLFKIPGSSASLDTSGSKLSRKNSCISLTY